MELTDRGVVVRTSWGESSTWWQGILSVEATPEHLFVYTSSVSAAHVVPKNRVLEGSVADLEPALRKAVAQQSVAAPVSLQRAAADGLPASEDSAPAP